MNEKSWNQIGRLTLALALGLALFLLWLLSRLPVAHAANLTVCLSGPCDYASIQAAVDAAIPGDVIKVAAGVYTGVNSYGGMTQTVYISKSLTIRGGYTTTNGFAEPPDPVANPTTLDAKGQGRVVYIASSTSVTVENLFLTGGNAAGDGGGIYHAGDDLILSNTVVFSNSAFFSGGGIYNAGGVLAVSNGSVIAHNRTTSSGFGGGIQNGGTLTVTDSTVRDNYASNNGGGIYNNGIATIADSMILSNTMSFVGLGGGGIFNDTGGVMTIDSSTIAYNVTTAAPVCAAQGGGIRNGGTLTITNSTISDNSADESGGGMYIAGGAATLTGITISGNNAGSGSSADKHGGGMVVVGGSTLTITNSTISGNSAADDGAGIYVNTATVYLFNVTISDNSAASEAGGIDNYGTVYFKNTIIAGNTANVSDPDCRNLYGWPLTSQGYNLVQTISPGCNISGDTATNITGEYPLLGPLADNGGDTETHALLSGSPAIDAGTCVDAPATDQRGVARPQDMNCDIGAYEVLQTCFATPDNGANVYSSVQQAVDAAGSGGTVKVAGYCSGVQMRGGLMQTVYVSKTVTIRGGYTTTNGFADPPDPVANPTTLDAQGLGRVMVITGTITPTIEGLRITGGDATLLGGRQYGGDAGGGVYVYLAAATISNCTVYSNTASTSEAGWGGGIYVEQGAVTLDSNIVQDNIAGTASGGTGGGVFLNDAVGATLEGNTVRDNTATTANWGYGGGVGLDGGDVTLNGNTIISNTAGAAWGLGGGVHICYSSATLTGNTVSTNTAGIADHGSGGGLFIASTAVELISNTVTGNTASISAQGSGGGIKIEYSDALLVNNTVQGNTASVGSWGEGGGLSLYDNTITMTNNTVVSNTASSAGEGWGGGVQAVFEECSECVAVFEENSIQNNIASATSNGWGGGLHIYGGSVSSIVLTGNTVVSNTATLNPIATGEGGGVWIGDFWGDVTFTMTNNLVAGNHAATGSGLYVIGDQMGTTGQLLHNTIADNANGSGQGIYVGQFTTLVFTNTIIAGHTNVGITVTAGSHITLAGTLWDANGLDAGGAGTVVSSTNVYSDPAFADPATWDYHLTESSAAIDAGVDAGVTTDFEGDTRPLGDGFDIGCDESPFTAQADVSIAKSVTPTVAAPSQAITYTLTFTSTGPHPARGVLITDAVPLTLTNVSYTNVGAVITPTGSFSYTWEVENLAPGQGGVITVTAVVATGVSGVFDLSNQAEITTTTDDPMPSNNVSTASNTIDAVKRLYLPVVFNDYVLAPDLVVEQIIATDNSIQVVVKNEGNATVVESFWVDVYINPDPVPTHANQTWPDVASEGLAWGVNADLEPGETLTLTVGGAYYKPGYSNVSWPLAVGTEVYAQVDSYNVGTTYGRVLENHEIRGETYNNISHVTVQTFDLSAGAGWTETPAMGGYPLVTPADLPPRSKKQPELE